MSDKTVKRLVIGLIILLVLGAWGFNRVSSEGTSDWRDSEWYQRFERSRELDRQHDMEQRLGEVEAELERQRGW